MDLSMWPDDFFNESLSRQGLGTDATEYRAAGSDAPSWQRVKVAVAMSYLQLEIAEFAIRFIGHKRQC